jgi:glycerol-3-phosphate dehydrogenase
MAPPSAVGGCAGARLCYRVRVKSSSLNSARRAAEIEELRRTPGPVDLVVIGAGIVGVGVALDAASRGLRTVLVERHDLAHGTSRWTSKLAHGGLRYLAQGDVAVAWESARERHLLLTTTAVHLTRPLPGLIAFGPDIAPARAALVQAGIRSADMLRRGARTSRKVLPPPRRTSALEAVNLFPSLRREGLRGALLHWDGQLEDDARLVTVVARTAALHGASVLTRMAAVSVERGAVNVRDELSGEQMTIPTRAVVNAAGVWASDLAGSVKLRPSKGCHLIIAASTLGWPRAALTVPVPGEPNRWCFAVPMSDERVLVGITDDPHQGPVPDEPEVTPAEQSFLLATISRALDRELSGADVIGSLAGFRPLIDGGEQRTSDLSRRHTIVSDAATGMLTAVGGKLTTYRAMSEQVVDRAVQAGNLSAASCITARLPLVGSAPVTDLLRLAAPTRLVRRYGMEVTKLMEMAAADPALLEPVAPGLPVLGVEFAFGVRHEGALTAADLLDRRTRLGLVPGERGAAQTAAEAAVATAVTA